LLDGFGSTSQNAKRASEVGIPALAITDHGNCFGHMEHYNSCKKHGIKPILGNELYICHEDATKKSDRGNCHMVVFAKNQTGLETLWQLTSQTNHPDYFYYRPRIHLFNTENIGLEHFVSEGNIIGISGHQGSHLSDNLFCDRWGDPKERSKKIKAAYQQKKNGNTEFYRQFLKDGWLEDTCKLALKMQGIFGEGNFYIELQNELSETDKIPLFIHPLIVECLRKVSKETGIKATISSDPHYANPEDAQSQRLMVMTKMKETEASVENKLMSNEDGHDLMTFFVSDNFYIHSPEEMSKKFTDEEMQVSNDIADMIDDYTLAHKPYIPEYKISKDLHDILNKCEHLPIYKACKNKAEQYLTYLCITQAQIKQPWNKTKYSKEDYWNRLSNELNIIYEAELSNYFLVVWDYCMAADYRPADHSFNWSMDDTNTNPIPRALGRGSACGCLISYLTGVTGIDPLEYGLIFGRFYNKGRNTGDHIELPDIDIDFSVEGREWIIEYIKHKYGNEQVAQMITFQRMQGKAALKDIFRVKDIENYFELANEISKYITDEASISDELQELRQEFGDTYGLIQYALDHSDEIKKFYNDEKLKPLFEQAIKCEGRKRSQGKHPSGVVVTPKPINQCFPMALDTKTKELLIGFDMNDAAKSGATKLDILGTTILDKLKMVEDLVNEKG